MITEEMKNLLDKISDLCYQAGNEVIENEETEEILNTCDMLQELIDSYLAKESKEGNA